MASCPRNYPFYNWVPKPVGILILILLFIPILTTSGVYTANSTEMFSGLGILSEHIQYIGFLTSIGMAAFCPFFYDLVCIRREKLMCVVGFAILCVLSWICAQTDSLIVLGVSSVLMGFLRMVLMMVNLFTLIKYAFGMEATRNITPGNDPCDEKGWDRLDAEKSVSQPLIYVFFMILGQIGTSLTAWLAYEYEWQYVYYFMIGSILLSMLVLLLTMPWHLYDGHRIPVNFSKFGNVVVFCVMCAAAVYVMVYGKVLDWYDSPSIQVATVVAIVFAGWFVYMEKTQNSPYFLLEIFKLRTIRMGVLLFFLLMVFNSSAMFVNVFAGVGMKIDNWQNASLSNWSMLGYIVGCIIALILVKKGVHLKYIFALGFVLIGCSALFMYFEVQTYGLYERMKYPVIIRSVGMMLLYSLTAVHANQRMPYKYLSTWICVMLTVRMAIGPGAGSSLYTNILQHRQQYYITSLAQDRDLMNPEIAASYVQTLQGMKYQGKSEMESQNMAAVSAKGKIQIQATLSALKEMAGWTFYGCISAAFLMVLIPWRKRRLNVSGELNAS